MKQKLHSILASLAFVLLGFSDLSGQSSRDVAVELKSSWKSGSGLELSWKSNANAIRYYVYRKNGKNWDLLDSVGGSTTTYLVGAATLGKAEEYRVAIKNSLYTTFLGNGYITSGFNLPVSNLGTVLVLIDSNYSVPLKSEITEYIHWLEREGWKVKTKSVLRSESVANVKSWIKSEYLADSLEVKTAILLGRIPVPYSGNFRPDGHTDHTGAWPADLYYGTFYTNWTDNTVNNTSATRSENRNTPGDGKFDISRMNTAATLPSAIQYVQLPVGRIDFSNMGSFGNDTLLMKRYLRKNLNFRSGKFKAASRALIDDNFGYFSSEAFASGGYRMFSVHVGDSIYDSRDFRTYMKNESYLMSYGCGAGTYTSASGVASSSDFVNDSLLNPFTLTFGSYYGDWDNADNFLRAPLASKGWGLASVWSGRPYWVMHETGLGKPLYKSVLTSQNAYNMYNVASNYSGVHVALMGDPTLKYYYVPVANKFTAKTTCDKNVTLKLSWDSLAVDSVILWENTAAGWQKVAQLVGNTTQYSVPYVTPGKHHFAIQGLKLMTSASGSWWDLGAKTETSVFVNELPVIKLNQHDIKMCLGSVYQVDDTGSMGVHWRWQFSNGRTDDSTQPSLRYEAKSANNLKVLLTVTSDSGCIAEDSLKILVRELPSPKILEVGNFCYGVNADISVNNTSGYVMKWYQDAVLTVDTQISWKWVTPIVGKHEVIIVATDDLGCSGADTMNFEVYQVPQKPVITVTKSARFRGDTLVVEAKSNVGNIQWMNLPTGSGVVLRNDSAVGIAIPSGSGVFNVLMSVSAKTQYCESDTAMFMQQYQTNGVRDLILAGAILKTLGNQQFELVIPTGMLVDNDALLSLVDMQGRTLMASIPMSGRATGNGFASWEIDASALSSGVYQLRLVIGSKQFNQALVIK